MQRRALHAPNHVPQDSLPYRACLDVQVQGARATVRIPCGPGGVIHDYVPFYFGYLSPMMLKLKTGQVAGYDEGHEPLVYLVSRAQAVQNAGVAFVFSDGHGLAVFTDWFDDLKQLDAVDWSMVNQRYWSDNLNDMDRQRRKQAEFLIHKSCPWGLIDEIVVIDSVIEKRVKVIQDGFSRALRKPIRVERSWYY
jgi:ssDNA thymidine ADP-ribosyltransferase DarT-like protein